MSVKDRLRRKVQSFHESDIECPDEDALLELVERATRLPRLTERQDLWTDDDWLAVGQFGAALRRITEES